MLLYYIAAPAKAPSVLIQRRKPIVRINRPPQRPRIIPKITMVQYLEHLNMDAARPRDAPPVHDQFQQ